MFNYHNTLKKYLRTEKYIVIPDQPPFAYRFIFPEISKSIPIREYRVPEYLKYLK
jgi:hypothetical protein